VIMMPFWVVVRPPPKKRLGLSDADHPSFGNVVRRNCRSYIEFGKGLGCKHASTTCPDLLINSFCSNAL
jgi:hypothetical protein